LSTEILSNGGINRCRYFMLAVWINYLLKEVTSHFAGGWCKPTISQYENSLSWLHKALSLFQYSHEIWKIRMPSPHCLVTNPTVTTPNLCAQVGIFSNSNLKKIPRSQFLIIARKSWLFYNSNDMFATRKLWIRRICTFVDSRDRCAERVSETIASFGFQHCFPPGVECANKS
jgi:hypothetical protein